MKDRLEKIADAADALEDANRRVAKSLEERKAIVADQARLRENLRVAPGGSDLAKIATRKLTSEYEKTGSLPAESPVYSEGGIDLYTDDKNAAALASALGGGQLISSSSASQ